MGIGEIVTPVAIGWILTGSVVAGMWLRRRLYRARLRRLFVLLHTRHPMSTKMPTVLCEAADWIER